MENEKYYTNLYHKYKALKAKAKLAAYDVGPGWEINTKSVDPKDLEEMKKVREKLKDCLEFLTNEQLKDLSSDDYFSKGAEKILAEREGE